MKTLTAFLFIEMKKILPLKLSEKYSEISLKA